MSVGNTTLSIATLCLLTLTLMTFSITPQQRVFWHNDIQHNNHPNSTLKKTTANKTGQLRPVTCTINVIYLFV